jgi:hypothetical protein
MSPVTPILPMQYPCPAFPPPATLVPMRRSGPGQKRASKLSVAPSYYDDSEFPESKESFEGRRTTSIGSSEWSILPASNPAMPQITEVPVMVSEASCGPIILL